MNKQNTFDYVPEELPETAHIDDVETSDAKESVADKAHRAKINNEALYALKELINNPDKSMSDGDGLAKAIIEAIAKGYIPHVKICY